VDANEMLVQVADPDALDLLFAVTPTSAARVRNGAVVRLRAGQSASGEALGDGRVLDVAASVDTATRSVGVRVRATRPSRPLRIGETLFGEIIVATRPRAIVVPLEALVPEGEGFKVFVVDSAGVAHARPVTVGGRSATGAEITEGIAAGERVVTAGAFGVEDGARIESAKP
jgi:RND family efflux transporter MFP subunit